MEFKIVELQINDIFILANKIFVVAKEVKLQKVKLLAKAYDQQIIDCPIKFNRGFITLTANHSIYLN